MKVPKMLCARKQQFVFLVKLYRFMIALTIYNDILFDFTRNINSFICVYFIYEVLIVKSERKK